MAGEPNYPYRGKVPHFSANISLGGYFATVFSGSLEIRINEAFTRVWCRVNFDSNAEIGNGDGSGGGFYNVAAIGWVNDSEIYAQVFNDTRYNYVVPQELDGGELALDEMDDFITDVLNRPWSNVIACAYGIDNDPDDLEWEKGPQITNRSYDHTFTTTEAQLIDDGEFRDLFPIYAAARWLDQDDSYSHCSINPMQGLIWDMDDIDWDYEYYPWARKIGGSWESLNRDYDTTPSASRSAYFRRKESNSWADILNNSNDNSTQMAWRKQSNAWKRAIPYGNNS